MQMTDMAVLPFQYDLRAVLMHDGQKGREHVYSYINHEDAWWKVVGRTITQVRPVFSQPQCKLNYRTNCVRRSR